jgi:hypothetical protein
MKTITLVISTVEKVWDKISFELFGNQTNIFFN